MNIRRVVTGHDAGGKAVVQIDEVSGNVNTRRPGHSGCVVWTTETTLADNSGAAEIADEALRDVGGGLAGGSIFRIVEYLPGVAPRDHRTDTIDYAVVMSGEIEMDLEGTVVNLKAGDVLVQRGTLHNWVNHGTEPCIIAFVLIGATPVEAGGKTLPAVG